jgi:hypothetical protein
MRLAAVAALTVAAVALVVALAGCETSGRPVELALRAAPQGAALDWEERFPETGPALVFRVRSLTVTAKGWEAEIGIENRTDVAWELPADDPATQGTFGLMLFADDDLARLEQLNGEGRLPAPRAARSFTPALPPLLQPGASWSGRIGAPGSLPAGRYVRVVFGALDAAGEPPEGVPATVVWITDHAHRLE